MKEEKLEMTAGGASKQHASPSEQGTKWNTVLLVLGLFAVAVVGFFGGKVSVGGDAGLRLDTPGFMAALAKAREGKAPGREVTQTEVEQAKPKTANLPWGRVLWIDDHPLNNQFEREALARIGIFADSYTNNSDGLAALSRSTYDLIISDIHRDDTRESGWELLKRIREGGRNVPFFFYTGSAPDPLKKEAAARGATGATANPDELLKWVIDATQTRRGV